MPRRSTEIIAIGGGKGGSGRSTLALTLACSLSEKGRKVLLIDTDTTAPTLHLHLDLPPVPPPETRGLSDPEAPIAPFIRESPIGPSLLSFAYARNFPYVRPKLDAPSILARLRDLPFDQIILDLPPGHDPVCVAFLALSDFPIVLIEPTVIALSVTTQNMRASIFHALGFHPDCYSAEEELLLLMRELPLSMNRNTMLPAYLSSNGRRIVRDTCAQFIPNIIINKTSPTTPPLPPAAVAHAIALAWYQLLGIYPRPLGHLPLIDTSSNSDRPFEEAVSVIIKKITRSRQHSRDNPRPITEAHTPHGILGLAPTTPPTELREILRQTITLFRDRWPPLTQILSQRDLNSLADSVDRAQISLLARHPELAGLPDTTAKPDPPPHAVPRPVRIRTPDAKTQSGKPATVEAPSQATIRDLTAAVRASRAREAEKTQKQAQKAESQTSKNTTKADPPSSTHENLSTTDDDDLDLEETADNSHVELFEGENNAAEDAPISEDTPEEEPPPLDELGADYLNPPAPKPEPPPPAPSPDLAAPEPEPTPPPERNEPPEDPPRSPNQAKPEVSTSLEPDIAPPPANWPSERPSPGELIRQTRRRHGVSLRELSLRTKIGLKYLQAIEEVDRRILPRPVYLRGYLREIAQSFDIDPAQLIDQYFAYLGYP